jgi:hypothetical protein
MESRPDVMVRVNTAPGVYASGDVGAVYRELDRVLETAMGREKVCIGSGTLPYDADPELVLKAGEYVRG